MKFTALLALFLITLARAAGAVPPAPLDLVAATTAGQAAVTAQASGLGTDNLACTVTNRTGRELRLRVPPGLHFEASDPGAQDLFTYQQLLLVLAPGGTQLVRLRGFCMEKHDRAPRASLTYALQGWAGRGLRPLADSLQKYPGLADGYGQMFVWALTDREPVFDVRVVAALSRGARNVLRYIAAATGQPEAAVVQALEGTPSVRTFSKHVVLLYQSPVAQVASLKVFRADGRLVRELFANRTLAPGVARYSYGLNATVPTKDQPVFFVRLLAPTGQVLKEVRIDDATTETTAEPTTLKFVFSFALAQPVNSPHFRVRLPDGTLVADLGREGFLPAGPYQFNLGFHHLYPPGTAFVARLETPTGTLIRQQPIALAR